MANRHCNARHFTVFNTYLIAALKQLNLWDNDMLHELKQSNGKLKEIARIPNEIKTLYITAIELNQQWLIELTSRCQKWVDQAISLSLYVQEPNIQKLDELYKLAWLKGLKTTYQLFKH